MFDIFAIFDIVVKFLLIPLVIILIVIRPEEALLPTLMGFTISYVLTVYLNRE